MDGPSHPPLLLQLIFGDASSEVHTISPRLELWVKAFDDWLASIEAARGRAARRQALRSWELLLRFRKCLPWDIDRSGLESWSAHLAKTGLSANTVRCYQGRISGFYRFCSKRPDLLSVESMFGPPGKPFNPLHGAPKPEASNYQNAYLLRPSEARALLNAIDSRSSLLGKRDYALLLTLLLTGLPEGELRQLRWKHSQVTPQGVRLVSASAADGAEIPPAAWSAILAFLESSGRLASIQPDDYVFVPLADPLLRPPSGQAEDWQGDRPLSSEQMYAFLKCYAAWAGLDASRVTYASLRHTAAALRLEAGADVAGLHRFLSRKYLKETRRYIGHLGRMLGRRKPHSPRYVRRPGLPTRARGIDEGGADRRPYQRKKPYAQPGNRNALKHGFYSNRPLEIAPQDVQATLAATLEGEIIALRLIMRRAMELTRDPDNLPDLLRKLDLFGLAAMRVARLLLRHKELQAGAEKTSLDRALANIAKEMDLP